MVEERFRGFIKGVGCSSSIEVFRESLCIKGQANRKKLCKKLARSRGNQKGQLICSKHGIERGMPLGLRIWQTLCLSSISFVTPGQTCFFPKLFAGDKMPSQYKQP